MKEQLIKLLGLKADATDEAVVAAVNRLQQEAVGLTEAIGKLNALLDLGEDATERDVIESITALKRKSVAETNASREDKAIRELIAQSNGALSRDAAKLVLADRALHAAGLAAKSKK